MPTGDAGALIIGDVRVVSPSVAWIWKAVAAASSPCASTGVRVSKICEFEAPQTIGGPEPQTSRRPPSP